MALIPHPVGRDLWTSADPIATGAHLLIIGISAYPFLAGGSARDQATGTGGMGQLVVSALTSAKIFHFIQKMTAVAGAPIATCRILLAPNGRDEKDEVDRLTQGHYGSADFESIRSAVEAWGRDIFNSGQKAGDTVAFFFFSGHGVEHRASPALLASDIFDAGSPNSANRAISHDALLRAVKTFGIDRGLFFVDACRDAPEVVKRQNVVGREILEPYIDPSKAPDALISLQSTRQLFKSYQTPGSPATFFGQALLEALDGPAPSFEPYDTTSLPWLLKFHRLESHVKQRVRELLAERTTARLQPVEPYGYPYNGEMLVAEKPGLELHVGPVSEQRPDDAASSIDGGGPIAGQMHFEAFIPPVALTINELVATRSASVLKGFAASDAQLGTLQGQARAAPLFSGDLSDVNIMHGVFGHEYLTTPWVKTLKILDARSGASVAPETVVLCAARKAEDAECATVWLDLEISHGDSPGEVVWIGIGGDHGTPSFAVTVPRDETILPVRLDVCFRPPESGESRSDWVIEAFSARLAETKDRIWQGLWEMQRIETLSDLGSAGSAGREFRVLEKTLEGKRQSPVAAAIATAVLLRCDALNYLHDWPRNLADWFSWLPDGALLWAETKLRHHDAARRASLPLAKAAATTHSLTESIAALAQTEDYREARDYFSMLAERGPPLLAASLRFAIQQVPIWRRVAATGVLTPREHQRLLEACDVVDRASQSFASGGVFAGFASTQNELSPANVFGGHATARAAA
jgi:hypothetical protein